MSDGLVIAVLQEIGLTLGERAFDGLLSKRRRAAHEVLIGVTSIKDVLALAVCSYLIDEIVPILFRYLRAAEEGVARRNLRVLAAVIAGQKITRDLHSDKFLAWSDVLASLRREEMLLIGTMFRLERREREMETDETKVVNQVLRAATSELTERHLISSDRFDAVAAACLRTGLIVTVPLMSNRPSYKVSPLLHELAALIDVEQLFTTEPV